MAPIYDTDVAEERWTADVWKTYELWEKVERRFKRKRRVWLAAAGVAFVLLSSIPVLQDSMPKWQSLKTARVLATLVSEARLRAAHGRQPVRLSVVTRDGEVLFRMERAARCDSRSAELIAERPAFGAEFKDRYVPLPPDVAVRNGIPGIVTTYCYDPFTGGEPVTGSDRLLGFALLPVSDLAEQRFDRMSMVLIDPISGAVSID